MKRLLKSAQFTLLALGVATLLSVPAKADLIGSTLSWQYYAFGGVLVGVNGPEGGTFVDNGGIGGTFETDPSEPQYFNIIADGSSITFDYSPATAGTWTLSQLSLAPTIYNGIAIDMVSGPAFDSVTIDPATNMVGFDASRFSFTGNEIQVDWQGLSYDASTIVKLDINSTPVPEPKAGLLLATGLAALVVVERLRPTVRSAA